MRLNRLEKAWNLMENAALKGKFGIRLELYNKEAVKIKKELGVLTTRVSPVVLGKAWYELSWVDAFKDTGLTPQESFYMSFVIDDMPPCDTLAKELYLLSGRNSSK